MAERACFYCGESARWFENDHFPVPQRAGGTRTVLACRRCHHLKDRMKLHRWTPGMVATALGSIPEEVAFRLLGVQAVACCHDLAMPGREEATWMVRACASIEGRLFVAASLAVAYDVIYDGARAQQVA